MVYGTAHIKVYEKPHWVCTFKWESQGEKRRGRVVNESYWKI